jgi:hypothetical protein
MEIYQHFKNPRGAKQLFIQLGQMDQNSYRMWKALMNWMDKDYPGTWQDWWDRVKDDPDS